MAFPYIYKGVRAYQNYHKDCWIVKFNGVEYHCEEHEIHDTIDSLLDGTY